LPNPTPNNCIRILLDFKKSKLSKNLVFVDVSSDRLLNLSKRYIYTLSLKYNKTIVITNTLTIEKNRIFFSFFEIKKE
jgi:hypothetical protein